MSSETRIENDVRSALRREPRIKHPELIAVSVDEIGTVALRGAVESPLERQVAVHVTRRVDGVFDVTDRHLKVHPPLTRHRADDEIRVAALERLIGDSRIQTDHIDVQVSDGRVTLTGHVTEESQRDYASEDVAGVASVVGVTNQLRVT